MSCYSCHIRAKSFVLDACRCFSLRLPMRNYQSEFALVEDSARNYRQGSSSFLSTTFDRGEITKRLPVPPV